MAVTSRTHTLPTDGTSLKTEGQPDTLVHSMWRQASIAPDRATIRTDTVATITTLTQFRDTALNQVGNFLVGQVNLELPFPGLIAAAPPCGFPHPVMVYACLGQFWKSLPWSSWLLLYQLL